MNKSFNQRLQALTCLNLKKLQMFQSNPELKESLREIYRFSRKMEFHQHICGNKQSKNGSMLEKLLIQAQVLELLEFNLKLSIIQVMLSSLLGNMTTYLTLN